MFAESRRKERQRGGGGGSPGQGAFFRREEHLREPGESLLQTSNAARFEHSATLQDPG